MTPRHPDAGGLSVKEIAEVENWCRIILEDEPDNKSALRRLSLCAMARRALVLEDALLCAAGNFAVIQTLNSHGASDRTYIGWLRANARAAEMGARAALAPTQSGGEGA